MAELPASPLRRWLVVVSAVFGLFVLFQLGLFSWLIFRSLSQREIDRILSPAREEASSLASQLEKTAASQDSDLFTAVAAARETRTYIDAVLLQLDMVEEVEVTDRDGVVVYRATIHETVPARPGEVPISEPGEFPESGLRREVIERPSLFQVEERIGDLGYFRVHFDRAELERRTVELREDLVRRSALIGSVTLVMLATAYLGIWLLLRRVARSEEEIVESRRMAYVGTLAAGLAHEIRNPLNSLSLNMQMLEEGLDEGHGHGANRRLLAITKAEIERLERLATDFLSYSRSRPLDRRRIAVGQVLAEVAEVIGREVEERQAELELVDETAGLEVEVDVEQVKQLLLNLLKNSLAAVGEGPPPRRIVLEGKARGQKVVLEVRDNGKGMSRQERERMFELFFSTRKGGTGLGLAIVDRIARAHGGQLEVDSEPGRGTSVRLVLPFERSQAPLRSPTSVVSSS